MAERATQAHFSRAVSAVVAGVTPKYCGTRPFKALGFLHKPVSCQATEHVSRPRPPFCLRVQNAHGSELACGYAQAERKCVSISAGADHPAKITKALGNHRQEETQAN